MGVRLEYTARRREGEPSTVKPNRRNSRLSQRKRNNLGIARDEDEGSYLEKEPLTLLKTTNYGSLRFPGSLQLPAKWAQLTPELTELGDLTPDVRVPKNSEYGDTLFRMLSETWSIPSPSALVSVLSSWSGPDDAVFPDESCAAMFTKAFANFTRSHKAWVLTHGLQTRAVALIGNAMKGATSQTPCIGIAPWNLTSQHALLARTPGMNLYYTTDDRSGRTVASTTDVATQLPLEPHHSHFLLVDSRPDESKVAQQLSSAYHLRTRLLKSIVPEEGPLFRVPVPVLCIVLAGDKTTLRMILEAIKENNAGVLLFPEAGGAAALLHDYILAGDSVEERKVFLQELHSTGEMRPSWTRDPDVDRLLQDIAEYRSAFTHTSNPKERISAVKLLEQTVERVESQMRRALLSTNSPWFELVHAVRWGDSSMLTDLLQEDVAPWTARDAGRALTAALYYTDLSIVQPLLDFGAEATHVDINILFVSSKIKYDTCAMHEEAWVDDGELKFMVRRVSSTRKATMGHLTELSHYRYQWQKVLSLLVSGYDRHFEARYKQRDASALRPTWTDLMMWAVLIGETDLAHMLWLKTYSPLRAVCIATKACVFLSKDPRNALYKDELVANAAKYEQWALDLLDEMPEDVAHPLLVLVKYMRSSRDKGAEDEFTVPEALWTGSDFHSAFENDGRLSSPCKGIITHKHAVSLADCYFCGDYFGSKARISADSSWLSIFIQMLLPFLPGLVCKVYSSSWPTPISAKEFSPYHSMTQSSSDSAVGNSPERAADNGYVVLSRHERKATDPKEDPTSERSPRVSFATGTGHDQLFKRSGHAGASQPEAWVLRFQAREARKQMLRQNDGQESAQEDFFERLAHLPALDFYTIPKVKFLIHQVFYLCYICLLPSILLWESAPSEVEWALPHYIMRFEVFYWAWSVSFLLIELEAFLALVLAVDDTSCWRRIREGAYRYLDAWNFLDLVVYTFLGVTIMLRVMLQHDETAQTLARAFYAIIVLLQWLRLLQSLRIFKKLGVLSITFGRIIKEDILPFLVFLAVLALSFGLAVCTLSPDYLRGGTDDYETRSLFRQLDSRFWEPWFAISSGFRMGPYYEEPKDVVAIDWLMPFMVLSFNLFLALLVRNLLVGYITSIITEVSENAKVEWQYEFVQLVHEYKDQRMFPAPFNAVHLLWRLIATCLRWIFFKRAPPIHTTGFTMQVPRMEELFLQAQEIEALNKCAFKHEEAKRETERDLAERKRMHG